MASAAGAAAAAAATPGAGGSRSAPAYIHKPRKTLAGSSAALGTADFVFIFDRNKLAELKTTTVAFKIKGRHINPFLKIIDIYI